MDDLLYLNDQFSAEEKLICDITRQFVREKTLLLLADAYEIVRC